MKRGRSLKELSPEEKKFIKYLSKPKSERKTQRALAKELDVSEKTLTFWKKRKDIWDKVYDNTLDYLQQDLPDILHAISKKAKQGSIKHAEMVLELTGKILNKGTKGNAVQVNINTNIPRNQEEIVEVKGVDKGVEDEGNKT